MENLLKIINLIGEENEKRLRDGITDLLLERLESDMDDMGIYLIDFEEILHEVRKEVKNDIKEKIVKKYLEMADKKVDELFNYGA